jgi:RES domain
VVVIALPPPDPRRRLNPVHIALPAGADLFRIYDPASRYRPGPLTFRVRGPFARMDHHEGTGADEPRGIWCGGLTLAGTVVEAFQSGVIEVGTNRLVRARTTRDVDLLELRGRAAMRAGTVNAIGSADHDLSQAWSRHFYEDPDGTHGAIDGVHWASAVNGDRVVALYERGADALVVSPGHDTPLGDPAVLAAVRRIAREHSLLVVT